MGTETMAFGAAIMLLRDTRKVIGLSRLAWIKSEAKPIMYLQTRTKTQK